MDVSEVRSLSSGVPFERDYEVNMKNTLFNDILSLMRDFRGICVEKISSIDA